MIKVLDKETILTIAAGEVVERPASIVKELIENALDAKATSISIQLENDGLDLLKVTDNGIGIPKDQLALALTLHATSKIRHHKELRAIASFGFRGEALASIAQAGKLTLASRTHASKSGWQLSTPQQKPKAIAIPYGTSVTLTDLFSQSPVRKGFLATSKTELQQILQVVSAYALAFPEIDFRVSHKAKTLLHASAEDSHFYRTKHILGSHLPNICCLCLIESKI